MRARVRDRPVDRERPGRGWHWVLTVTLVAVGSAWLAVAGGAWLRALAGIAGGEGVVPVLFVGLAVDHDADGVIDHLIEQVRRLEDGEYDLDLPTDRDDSVGQLATELGELAERLARRTERDPSFDDARRELYTITSDPELDDAEKLSRVLELGCDRLDVDCGLVSEIDPETDRYEVAWATGEDTLEVGTATDLSTTFCRKTITSDGILGIFDATREGWDDDPGCRERGVHCYIGGKIEVGGELHGTVCFFDSEPRAEPFSDAERTVVDLLARWISSAFERDEFDRQLRRKNRAVDAAPVGVTIATVEDDETRIEYVNRAFEELTGYEADEIRGRSYRFLRDGDTAPEHVAELRAAVETGDSTSVELRNYREDGEAYWNRVSIAPIDGGDPDTTQFVGFHQDITERKERERELERYRELVNAMRDSACIYDADGRFEVVGQALANFYGTTPEDLEGERSHLVERIREDADGDPYQELIDGQRDELRGEYESTYPEAGHAVVEYRMTRLTVDGEFGGVVAVARDVTERKERERQFRAIVENTIDPIYIKDREGNYQFVNEASTEFFGLARQEILGKDDGDLFDAASAASIREDDRTVLETGDSIVTERSVDVDGQEAVFLDNKYPFRDEDGEIVGTIGISRDITDRKENERELERYREFTDGILDTIDDVFYVLDRAGNLTRWNESLADVTGYDDAEMASMHAIDFFAEADRPDIEAAIDEVSETGRTRVDVALLTSDGTKIPYEFVATTLQTPDGEQSIAGIGRDVSEREEREAQLRERERELSTLMGNIPGMVYRCANDPNWPFEFVSEGCRAVTGYEPDEIEDGEVNWGEDVLDDDNDEIWDEVQRAVENRDPFQLTYRIEDADGDRRWLWEQGRGVFDDGGTLQALEGVVMDVTDQKRRELALQSLHDAARRLLGTETERDVTELVLEVAAEVVDTPAVGIYLLDSGTNTLEPTAFTDSFADLYDGPPAVAVGDADSLVWNTFVTETRTVVEHGDATDGTGLFDDGVRNGVLVPIGDHGVFVALSQDGRIDATTRQLVETLVATTEAALDRLDSEATLRERDAELEAQNERLRRQVGITEIIRSIDQSLIGASTHEEIERAVCERLVTDDTIGFAWIGTLDPDGESVTARQWAGEGESYLDEIAAGSASTPEPAWQAARTESPVVVENVVDDLQREGWRKPALAHGFHSAVAVPLVFDEYSYGVLAVYATEPGAFGDLERTVFAELGESIANSITAAKTRQALHAETLLELELRFVDADDLLARIASEADCRVAYEGLATIPDDDDRVFFVAHDTDPDAVRDVLDGLVSVTDTRLISDADGSLFEVTTAAPLVAAKLVSHGGRPQSITADHTGMDVVVDLPTGTDVRAFVEMLREDHPGVELVARRHVERSTHTRRELVTTLFETLTDRQREVLETAYLAGFFEQPRETTGEELAAMLGVSQPTVNRHLRLAQQRLMEQLFSTESGEIE
ncbi:PAS domain S-box protein [Halorientalis pallida]|uniref:PAS domain S-box protein n=1 Tax=Halorientalis pallida TaxID=2479928 RepID=A0A498L5I5_9EURY|nr:PAS domain S-box protein [Halorientalis pallida]RXK50547.1 PAS domain S-box protein [Halorientalis pallida]